VGKLQIIKINRRTFLFLKSQTTLLCDLKEGYVFRVNKLYNELSGVCPMERRVGSIEGNRVWISGDISSGGVLHPWFKVKQDLVNFMVCDSVR